MSVFFAHASDPWWNTSWSYRVAITINPSQVPSTQTNFPVYVDLANLPSSFWSHVNANGSDIRVTNSSGTELARQVVTINTTTDTGELWFNADSLANSDYFYMYYGNASATEPAASASDGSQSVWTNGYDGVWHMDEPGTPSTWSDSTSNGNTGTNNGATAITGKIAGGASLVASNNNSITTNYVQNNVTQYTIAAWVKTTTSSGVIVQDRGSGAGLSITLAIDPLCGGGGCTGASAGKPAIGVDSNAIWQGMNGSQTITDNTWHYVVGTFYSTPGQTVTASMFKIYIDGVLSDGNLGNEVGTPTSPLTGLGGTVIGYSAAWNQYLTSQIDEVRISSVARSSDWITTEYNNQSAPASFYTVGSEETPSSGGLPGDMYSANYAITTDSINFGGGGSASANYNQQSTMGEIATGGSSSANYKIEAGYQQMLGSSISISSAPNVTLPSLGGLNAGTSLASSSWNVITDDTAGYELTVSANTSPALKDSAGAYFADYAPAGGSTSADYNFTVPSGTALFGFSPYSPDAISRFENNGSTCGSGSTVTNLTCWAGFTTTSQTIAQGSTDNQPNGATTTVNYEAGIGTNKVQDAGSYTATITVTAVAL